MYEFINFYPQFQNGRQIRVITHNKKLKEIKKVVQEQFKAEEVEVEMIMKALKPTKELSKKNIGKLKKQFQKYFPESKFEVLNEDNPNQIILRFNNTHETIFAMGYLEKLNARTHFAKNV